MRITVAGRVFDSSGRGSRRHSVEPVGKAGDHGLMGVGHANCPERAGAAPARQRGRRRRQRHPEGHRTPGWTRGGWIPTALAHQPRAPARILRSQAVQDVRPEMGSRRWRRSASVRGGRCRTSPSRLRRGAGGIRVMFRWPLRVEGPPIPPEAPGVACLLIRPLQVSRRTGAERALARRAATFSIDGPRAQSGIVRQKAALPRGSNAGQAKICKEFMILQGRLIVF